MALAPVRAGGSFCPDEIVVTKGARARPHYEEFLGKIRRAYPRAQWIERPDVSHMSARPSGNHDEIARTAAAKKTLAIGTLGRSVRRSQESDIVCPNYWHFSTTSFCHYDCLYCYLAGSCSTIASPAVKVYVNLEQILAELLRKCSRLDAETSFYLGKLQDGLNLDFLTNYSKILVPFFAEQRHARFVFLTKSDDVTNLVESDHRGRTIATWSVNAPAFARRWERGAPSVHRRLIAARQCSDAGYPVRFIIMPMLPACGWENHYEKLIEKLFSSVLPQRITLGGICSFPTARRLACTRSGSGDELCELLSGERLARSPDGRLRFPRDERIAMYRFVIDRIQSHCPDMPVALCLETADVWHAVELRPAEARCNCVV